MASKTSSFELVIDARPDVGSGVFGSSRNIDLHTNFHEAVNSGQVWPLGERKLRLFKSNNQISELPRGSLQSTPVEVEALVGFHSKDILFTTKYNASIGVLELADSQSAELANDKSRYMTALSDTLPELRDLFSISENGVEGAIEIARHRKSTAVFIKPALGTGSLDILRVNPQSAEMPSKVRNSYVGYSDQARFVVMDDVSSGDETTDEFGLNIVVLNSKVSFASVHRKVRQERTGVFRDEVISTCELSKEQERELDRISNSVAQMVTAKHAVFHVEVRCDMNGNWIPIDIATRPDGGLVPEMVFATTGVDLRLCQLYSQVGRPDRIEEHLKERGAISGSAAAIGAFYGRQVSEDLLLLWNETISSGKVGKDRVYKAVFGIDYSNIAIQPTEVRAALCCVGSSAKTAIDCLNRVSSHLGLRPSSEIK